MFLQSDFGTDSIARSDAILQISITDAEGWHPLLTKEAGCYP